MSNWYDDLCEYYGVSHEDAVVLGTRRTGRRPNLPGSKTCKPVSGKNFEELWDMNPRDTIQQKMDFYKDIGAWQVFRQCNYRRDTNYRNLFFQYLKPLVPSIKMVEYGCGIAPVTNYIIEHRNELGNLTSSIFVLVDVEGEHLEFAKWRLQKKAPDLKFVFHQITEEYMLPYFNGLSFDIISIMDVFEHLPNPYNVLSNLDDHSHKGTILVETWRDGKPGGPDLQEAEDEKQMTLDLLKQRYDMIKRGSIRVHRKQ